MHATSSPAHNAAHTTTESERANSIAAAHPAQTPNAHASTGGIAGREGNETSSSTARSPGTIDPEATRFVRCLPDANRIRQRCELLVTDPGYPLKVLNGFKRAIGLPIRNDALR